MAGNCDSAELAAQFKACLTQVTSETSLPLFVLVKGASVKLLSILLVVLDDAPSASELKHYIDEMQTDFTTQLTGVQTAVNVSVADTAKKVNESCVGLGKQVEKRIAPLEARIRVTETRIDDVFADIKALRCELGVAQTAVVLVPPSAAGAKFVRNVDPAIIVLRANAMKSRGAVMASFKGATNYASRLVNQTLGVFKPDAPGGTWKKLHVESLDRQKVEIFAGPDKSTFQIKREMACKEAKIAFDTKYPDRRICINREKGMLSYQWKELLDITPQCNEVPSLRWKIRNLEALGFDVEALRAGTSDHSPACVYIQVRQEAPAGQRSMPRVIFNSQECAEFLSYAWAAAPPSDDASQPMSREDMKTLMDEAARSARDRIILRKSIAAEFLAIRSCARAVFQGDFLFAQRLLRSHPLARGHLDAQLDSRQVSRLDLLRKRQKGLAKMQQLWSPFDKRMHLAVVRLDNGTSLTEPNSMLHQSGDHWKSIFTAKQYVSDAASAPLIQRAPKMPAVIDRPDRGTTRACADDVGMALRLSVHLLRASRVFEEAERAANLRAKSITCTIAPLCGPLTARLNCRIKAWLLEQIPAWKDSVIDDELGYLGMLLGPAVTPEDPWIKPVDQHIQRSRTVGGALPHPAGELAVLSCTAELECTRGGQAEAARSPTRCSLSVTRPFLQGLEAAAGERRTRRRRRAPGELPGSHARRKLARLAAEGDWARREVLSLVAEEPPEPSHDSTALARLARLVSTTGRTEAFDLKNYPDSHSDSPEPPMIKFRQENERRTWHFALPCDYDYDCCFRREKGKGYTKNRDKDKYNRLLIAASLLTALVEAQRPLMTKMEKDALPLPITPTLMTGILVGTFWLSLLGVGFCCLFQVQTPSLLLDPTDKGLVINKNY
ncbi:unnamed protein product [Prorocentrum cordatum]|uniref:Uncharacterized protein n=1 Tax=Prorocentrum cordatum TaxID=2364126 RepID=A0ABN9RX79_9DINO|nr:unnamed protein product [Polarella glacialis]